MSKPIFEPKELYKVTLMLNNSGKRECVNVAADSIETALRSIIDARSADIQYVAEITEKGYVWVVN